MTQNDWDAAGYDGNHSFVYEYGEDLIDLLDPSPGERILDLGCGTGHLTSRIAERGAGVVGVDRADSMLAEARRSFPELTFVNADAADYVADRPFDAVFSNAMLHWVPSGRQDAVIDHIRAALRPGGRFVAEMGGTGNVKSVVEAVRIEAAERGHEVDILWYFPSLGEYTARMEGRGFEVTYATIFDRPTPLDEDAGLEAWLETFGDSLLASIPEAERRAVIKDAADRLRPDRFQNGTWVLDYRRLRFQARKQR